MTGKLVAAAVGEWLRPGSGPESAVVVCSRARLARNLVNRRFAVRADAEERTAVLGSVRQAMDASGLVGDGRLAWHDLRSLSALERQMLVERHLVSREHAEAESPRAAAFDREERLSVMVVEEDHLRIQAFRSGLKLGEVLSDVVAVEQELSDRLPFAFDARFGYLTCCPTNVGTGLRVSVMLHLPALVLSTHAERAFRAAQELRLAVRGLYGEGTQAFGDLYQVSNQSTLGRTEEDIVRDLEAVILALVDYERAARERMLERERRKLEDLVWRAWGTLGSARLLPSEEAMKCLSLLRLGHALGWLPGVTPERWGEWFLASQPAHLQEAAGAEVGAADRDGLRADRFRDWLSGLPEA